jgi:hypothetical protein
MKQTPPPPLALTTDSFLAIVPMSRATFSRLVKSGDLPSFVAHGRRLIRYSDACEYVNRMARAGGSINPEISAIRARAGRAGREAQAAKRARAQAANEGAPVMTVAKARPAQARKSQRGAAV